MLESAGCICESTEAGSEPPVSRSFARGTLTRALPPTAKLAGTPRSLRRRFATRLYHEQLSSTFAKGLLSSSRKAVRLPPKHGLPHAKAQEALSQYESLRSNEKLWE
eukprot:479579-Amphidinium_carterae.1